MKNLPFLLLLISSLNIHAEVVSSSLQGFTIEIESEVSVDSQSAYRRFLEIGKWWNPEHTYFGKSENLYIEEKANGCFCETEGDKQVLHMIISYVEPGKEIRMIGGLGPLQMMGVNGGMSWRFMPTGKSTTKIIHRYQVVGYTSGGLKDLAPVVDQVQTLQVNNLVTYIESK